MEGITEIDKTAYIDECKEIVRNELDEELSDEMLTIVTNEIMDTCLFIGGDFKKENIIDSLRDDMSQNTTKWQKFQDWYGSANCVIIL